jgi:hypothetical protein
MTALNEQSVQGGSRCTRRIWLDTHAPPPRPSIWRIGRSLQREALMSAYVQTKGIEDAVSRASPWTTRVEHTEAQIACGKRDIIGGCFEHSGVRVTVDHMLKTEAGWTLIAVRGAASIKATHTRHLALALWVLQRCRLTVTGAQVVTINPRWQETDAASPFGNKSVLQNAQSRSENLDQIIPHLRGVLEGDEPGPTLGTHCLKPVPCPYLSRCQPPEPDHGLDELYRVKAKVLKQLNTQGITRIADIPQSTILPAIAARQREALTQGRVAVGPGLQDAVSQISRPTVYIDFEAIQPALPPWPNCRPFGVIPVQVSLHTLHEDGRLTHTAWLARAGQDPRPELAAFLAAELRDAATLVAYHASFEQSVLQRLEPFCSEEQSAILAAARTRIVDMLPMVRDNVYHPDFKGKFSLKMVVEALAPSLSYRDLKIRRGDEASLVLEAHCRGTAGAFEWSDSEREEALLAYCARDTMVMVHLEATLRELAQRAE